MLEPAIKTLLLASPAIAAAVGDRVKPLLVAKGTPRPFLSILITANQGNATHSGKVGSRYATVEICIVSDLYDDGDTLAEAIFSALNGYRGTVTLPDDAGGGSVRIAPATYDDESDVEQATPPGQQTPAYLKTVSYKCRYIATGG